MASFQQSIFLNGFDGSVLRDVGRLNGRGKIRQKIAWVVISCKGYDYIRFALNIFVQKI